jgi:two-component system response regulator RegX3
MPRVLIIDDEAPLRQSLEFAFTRDGFEVASVPDATSALAELDRALPDVVILDVILPGRDGFDICREIRTRGDVPVVMLTARDQVSDRLRGFDIGADDYVTKPFNTRELVARVHSVLRRRERAERLLAESRALLGRIEDAARRVGDSVGPVVARDPSSIVLQAGPVTLDVGRREATVRGRSIALAPAESALLAALLRERGRVVTRSELIAAVWGEKVAPQALALLETHMHALRMKLEPDPSRPAIIVSVPGIGFQLAPAA